METINGYEVHPAAALFPLMSEEELEALCRSIDDIGQLEPIVLDEKERIVDGRNRLIACERVGVKPHFMYLVDWELKDDPVGYVFARNIARRNLDRVRELTIREELEHLFSDAQKAQEASRFQDGHDRGNQYTQKADKQEIDGVAPVGDTVKPRGIRDNIKEKYNVGSGTAQKVIDFRRYLDHDELKKYLSKEITEKDADAIVKLRKMENDKKPKKLTEKQFISTIFEDELEQKAMQFWIPFSRKVGTELGIAHLPEFIELFNKINFSNYKPDVNEK